MRSRQRRTVVLLIASVVAAAAAPPARAVTIRPARVADLATRPTVPSEWWTLRALDPRSNGAFELRLQRELDTSRLLIHRWRPSGERASSIEIHIDEPIRAGRRTVATTAPDGFTGLSVRIVTGRRGVRAELSGKRLTGVLRLGRLKRGPAAIGFDVGPDEHLSWSVPVADSTVRGSYRLADDRTDFAGWRASYEHGWGHPHVGFQPRTRANWDSYLVHRGPATWLAFGLNRQGAITDPATRDARWAGVLARVGGRGMRACRPSVRRRRWVSGGAEEPRYAQVLRARCDRLRATFTEDVGSGTIADFSAGFIVSRPAHVDGRGDGWTEHRGVYDEAAG